MKHMAGVQFVAAEVVRGVEADAAGAHLSAEFFLFALQALELGFRSFAACEADDKSFEQGGDRGGLFDGLDAGLPKKLVA